MLCTENFGRPRVLSHTLIFYSLFTPARSASVTAARRASQACSPGLSAGGKAKICDKAVLLPVSWRPNQVCVKITASVQGLRMTLTLMRSSAFTTGCYVDGVLLKAKQRVAPALGARLPLLHARQADKPSWSA